MHTVQKLIWYIKDFLSQEDRNLIFSYKNEILFRTIIRRDNTNLERKYIGGDSDSGSMFKFF